jgi:hypothetical protein
VGSTAPEAAALQAHPIPASAGSMLYEVQIISLLLKDLINVYTLMPSAEEDEREKVY